MEWIKTLVEFHEHQAAERVRDSNGNANPLDVLVIQHMLWEQRVSEGIIPETIAEAATVAAKAVLQAAKEETSGWRQAIRAHGPYIGYGAGSTGIVIAILEALARVLR